MYRLHNEVVFTLKVFKKISSYKIKTSMSMVGGGGGGHKIKGKL